MAKFPKKPLVSVIMPVYNTGRFLSAAIESILTQTYKNFEFIIVDDASTDNSWKIIRNYSKLDKRIKIYRNRINLGVSLTSNIATSLAKGKLLARMDSDDISTPDRLQKQVEYLRRHPNTIVVGGQCTIISEDNTVVGVKKFPTQQSQIHDMIFWAVPIQQGYMMINRSLLPDNFPWYSPTLNTAEETDLFFRLLDLGNFANLEDNLYYYRQVNGSLSHHNPKSTFWLTLKSRINAINIGFRPSFKAVLINLAQIFLVAVLPNPAILALWAVIRGISRVTISFQSPILARTKV